MKNSKLFLIIFLIGLFIWINILTNWLFLIISGGIFLVFYLFLCVAELDRDDKYTVDLRKRYNIIQIIKDILDKLPQLIKSKNERI